MKIDQKSAIESITNIASDGSDGVKETAPLFTPCFALDQTCDHCSKNIRTEELPPYNKRNKFALFWCQECYSLPENVEMLDAVGIGGGDKNTTYGTNSRGWFADGAGVSKVKSIPKKEMKPMISEEKEDKIAYNAARCDISTVIPVKRFR